MKLILRRISANTQQLGIQGWYTHTHTRGDVGTGPLVQTSDSAPLAAAAAAAPSYGTRVYPIAPRQKAAAAAVIRLEYEYIL